MANLSFIITNAPRISPLYQSIKYGTEGRRSIRDKLLLEHVAHSANPTHRTQGGSLRLAHLDNDGLHAIPLMRQAGTFSIVRVTVPRLAEHRPSLWCRVHPDLECASCKQAVSSTPLMGSTPFSQNRWN